MIRRLWRAWRLIRRELDKYAREWKRQRRRKALIDLLLGR